METSLFRLRQRLLHDGEIEALDLDVHLDGRDPRACPGDLEIHVAKVVLGTENVGEDRVFPSFLDQAHRDTGDSAAHRHAGVEERE